MTTMGMGMCLRQAPILTLMVSQMFGESSGDIPVYSLHRIAKLMRRRPIAISATLKNLLERALIQANGKYREESGNKWNCLTSNNLVEAIEWVDAEVKKITDGVDTMPGEMAKQVVAAKAVLDQERQRCIKRIKDWFKENFESLLYDMNGKVPWAIILRLRKNLGIWIAGVSNPFSQDISDMVLETARENGIRVDTAEDAWEAMGGRLMNQ